MTDDNRCSDCKYIKDGKCTHPRTGMTLQDISTIRRFIGVVEGVIISLPEQTQSMIYDYIEVVDGILDKEEKAVMGK